MQILCAAYVPPAFDVTNVCLAFGEYRARERVRPAVTVDPMASGPARRAERAGSCRPVFTDVRQMCGWRRLFPGMLVV